ncbi:hypothetical protein PHLCEN_2v13350, partial [Hermanssonia centrifuga]
MLSIDLVDNIYFDKNEWVNNNKKWPSEDIPRGLVLFRDAALKIPESHAVQRFYDPRISVPTLFSQTLPKQSSALVHPPAHGCFSTALPNTNAMDLLARTIPPQRLLNDLRNVLGQALLDGAQSVMDPNSRETRYNLWIIQFWTDIASVLCIRARWKGCYNWLSRQPYDPVTQSAYDDARECLNGLSWNARVEVPGCGNIRTSDFATFLSDDRLTDKHIDIMLQLVERRVLLQPKVSATVTIGKLAFINQILKANNPAFYDKPSPPFLTKLEDNLKTKVYRRLYFVVFLAIEAHWIAFEIDFSLQTISYGDSLSLPKPKPIIAKIQWWLQKRFGSVFRDCGNTLEHGVQADAYSCGICAVNVIVHAVFDDSLWTHTHRGVERARWFLAMCRTDGDKTTNTHTSAGGALSSSVREASNIITPIGNAHPLSHRIAISALLNPIDDTLPRMVKHGIPQHEHGCNEPISDTAGINTASNNERLGVDFQGEDYDWMADLPTFEEANTNVDQLEDPSKVVGALEPRFHPFSLKRPAGEELEMSTKDKQPASTREKRKKPKVDSESAGGPVGLGRSTQATTKLNAAVKDGTFVSTPRKVDKFRQKIRELDNRVEFYDDRPKIVRHIPCGGDIAMQVVYNVSHFKRHIQSCTECPPKKAKLSGAGMRRLDTFIVNTASQPLTSTSKSSPPPPTVSPCTGLTAKRYPQIASYLERTSSLEGGSRSLTEIAEEEYDKPYNELTKAEKNAVNTAQKHGKQWENDFDLRSTFSKSCLKTIAAATPEPCERCLALFKQKNFKNTLSKKQVPDENKKYTPKVFRNQGLGEMYSRYIGLRSIVENPDSQHSPFMRFTQAVLDGTFKNDICVGFIQAMMLKIDKVERGVGMQNFKYAPAYDEFMHIINIHSPKAYRFIKEHIPGRTERNIRHNEARQPRFPLGITQRTFDLVQIHINKLEYHGPLGLSCDDTKLHPAFRPYYTNGDDGCYILGGTGEPLQIANPDEFNDTVTSGQLEKATKLRLWCLTIPLPKVAPLIIAALAIGNKANADELRPFTTKIIDGLTKCGINLVSLATDGAAVERSIQTFLEDGAARKLDYKIRHPSLEGKTIDLTIPCFGSDEQGWKPVVMIQDSQHARKTYRNNAYSGSRLLTLGNDVVMYTHARAIAFEDGPLYHRDVEKVDKQDDSAATRLFSADTLQWLADNKRDQNAAVMIYLFVFGELVDAYQSRTASHLERVHAALRAWFFVEMWESFLDSAGYSKSKHFLSYQACSITKRLVQGLIQLVLVFRDEYGSRYPLLPWLLSSEPCEHIFGLCRHIVKDFTLLDFYHMIPKLMVQLREVVLRAHHSNGKERAGGYTHTYTDHREADLGKLRIFPSDEEVNTSAEAAHEEALSLFTLLGVPPTSLSSSSPSNSAWFANNTSAYGVIDSDWRDGDSDSESEFDEDGDCGDEAAHLDNLIYRMEEFNWCTEREEMKLSNLSFAAISLSIEDSVAIHNLPEWSEDEVSQVMKEAADAIAEALAGGNSSASQSSDIDLEAQVNSTCNGNDINLDELISIRRAHQTKQASKGVRVRTVKDDVTANSSQSARQQLIRKLEEIIKQEQERGVGSGLERAARYTEGTKNKTGNSANAADVAKTRASKLLTRRRIVFKKYIPHLEIIRDAGISMLRPLKEVFNTATDGQGACFGLMLADNKVVLAKLLSVYSKAGGKNGNNGWVPSLPIITAATNLAVQTYEHAVGRKFSSIPSNFGQPLIKRHAFLPSNAFLCALSTAPTTVTGNLIEISLDDYQIFKTLLASLPAVRLAVNELGKKRRKKGEAGEDKTEDEV